MKKIIFTLIILCLSITPVSAYKLSLTGDNTIDKKVNITMDLTDLNTYDSFYGLTATLDYDNTKLELLEITGANDFNLTFSAKTKKIVLYNTIGTDRLISIINLKFKNINLAKDEETKISITNIIASDSNKDIKVDNIDKVIKATKEGTMSNTNLSNIKINGKSLDTSDNDINYEIVVSHDTKKIDINAHPDDGEATIIGNGSYELNEGNNEIKITVSNGEDVKTYTINVNREDSKSNIDEEDLFIKSKKFKWNNLYFIPIGVLLLIIITLIIKKKGIK